MGKKTSILTATLFGLFVFSSMVVAQEEQWLQYHSEREADRIVGDMTSTRLEVTMVKPDGVNLPQFKASQQLFTKWSTPMVDSGYLWIAIDRSSDHGPWDRLYIDSNINGHLDDAEAVMAYRKDRTSTYFGPVKVVFEVEDGPVSYHLNFRFYYYNESNRHLYAYSGGWYEGEITVAGQKKYCVLIDHNANGTFNDRSLNARECDRIRIGQKGTRDTRWVGKYIKIDDVYYRTEICRDGAFIQLSPAKDLKFGAVQMPETISELTIGGENGFFMIEPKNGKGELLVGKYRINHWEIDRKDDKGRNWTLRGRGFGFQGDFEIKEGSETSLKIGEPVNAGLSVRQRDDNYEFSKSLRGSLGEYLTFTSGGRDVRDRWKMKGKNKEGTFEKIYPIPDQ